MNTLREALQDYLALRRGLGYKMYDAGLLLPRFVSFLEERQAKHITARLALEGVQQTQTVQPAERARRLDFNPRFRLKCPRRRAMTRHWPARTRPGRNCPRIDDCACWKHAPSPRWPTIKAPLR